MHHDPADGNACLPFPVRSARNGNGADWVTGRYNPVAGPARDFSRTKTWDTIMAGQTGRSQVAAMLNRVFSAVFLATAVAFAAPVAATDLQSLIDNKGCPQSGRGQRRRDRDRKTREHWNA